MSPHARKRTPTTKRARRRAALPMPAPVDWPKELRRVRALSGLTQEQFASAIPVPVRTLARWESGVTTPSQVVKIRIYELAQLFEHARKLLKPKHGIRTWFVTPTSLLGGASALEFLRRPGGIQRIEQELGRLEWGVSV